MSYLEGKRYERDYGPLSLNKQGKALSYDVYYQRFRKIIREEMIPIFLKSDDPEVVFLVNSCKKIIFHPISLGHWYTTQLVLSGVNEVSELMSARGTIHQKVLGFIYKIKEKLQNNMVRLIMVF